MKLFNDETAKSKRDLEKKPDTWEIYPNQKTGLPGIIYLNGKEWFDSDKAWCSPSGDYIMHTGMDRNGNEALALTTKSEGITLKRTEDFIEAALATDDGKGYAISREGNLFILTQEKTSKKKMGPDEWTEGQLLTKDFCCIIYEGDSEYDKDNNEIMICFLKTIIFKTGATWKRKISYSGKGLKRFIWNLKITEEIIEVTTPDQTIHRFKTDGTQQ